MKVNKTKSYVLGFCFSEDKNYVALIHKLKPDWQNGKINGIGGKIEDNENELECMVREFKEETGVLVTNWISVGNLFGNGWKIFIFKSFDNKVFDCKTVEKEKVEVCKVSEILFERTIPNLKWLIPLALDKDDIKVNASEGIARCAQ